MAPPFHIMVLMPMALFGRHPPLPQRQIAGQRATFAKAMRA